ncbi:hypothetical protein HA402_013079 [Bradysia odoriphaga]|nr:hypothetical protein HA402_013079 [Bradysia odoriphaga]
MKISFSFSSFAMSNSTYVNVLIVAVLSCLIRSGTYLFFHMFIDNTDTIIVRKCIWKHENQNPCAIPTTLRPYSGPRTAHQICTICSDKDGCNGGSSLTNFTELVVLGVVAALMSTVDLYVQ